MGSGLSNTIFRFCAGLLALFVAGWTSHALAESSPIRIATDPWPGSAILVLAKNERIFYKYEVPVRLKFYSDYGEAIKAYKRHEVDSLQVAIPDAIRLYADGHPFVAPFVPVENNGFDRIVALAGTGASRSLKGKTVGVQLGTVGHYLLARELTREGLRFGDIRIEELGFDDAFKALQNGEIQAAALTSKQLMDPTVAQVLYSSDKDEPCPNVMIFEPHVATESVIKGILLAWEDAVKMAQRDTDKLFAIMRDELEFQDVREAAMAVTTAPFLDLASSSNRYYGAQHTIVDLAKKMRQFYVDESIVDKTGIERLAMLDTQWEEVFPREMLVKMGFAREPGARRPGSTNVASAPSSRISPRGLASLSILVAGLAALSIAGITVRRRRRGSHPAVSLEPAPHTNINAPVPPNVRAADDMRPVGPSGAQVRVSGVPVPISPPPTPTRRMCPQCGKHYAPSDVFCPTDGIPLIDAGRELASGTWLDQAFEIRDLLRREELGCAYLAWEKRLNRNVVVKVLDASPPAVPEGTSNWVADVEKASQLPNTNIVPILARGVTAEGQGYLVEQYIGDAVSLRQFIKDQVLDASLAVRFACETLSALQELHAHGLLHGHISPETILVCRRGDGSTYTRLADLGLSKVRRQSHTSGIHGAPTYVAPEVIMNGDTDARSDLYSLGVVLFEMICRKPPFEGNPLEVAGKNAYDKAPPLSSRAPDGTPKSLDRVVARLLEKKQEDRYASAADAAGALDAAMLGDDISFLDAPFPIAGAYHNTKSHNTAAATYKSLFDCVEATLHFLAMCVFSAATHTSSETDIKEKLLLFDYRSWPMGKYVEVIRELSPVVAKLMNIPVLNRIAGLMWLKPGKPTNTRVAIDELLKARNAHAHNKAVMPEEWYREQVPELRKRVCELMTTVGRVMNATTLVTPTEQVGSNAFRGYLHHGPQESFSFGQILSATQLTSHKTYLLSSQDGLSIELNPWVCLAICPHCQRHVLYAADGCSKEEGWKRVPSRLVPLVGWHGQESGVKRGPDQQEARQA